MLVDLALASALYGCLDEGWADVARLRRAAATTPLPRGADGRIVLGVDISPCPRLS
jgi:hypothetical protein